MAFKTGQVTHYERLLEEIKVLAVAQGWILVRDQTNEMDQREVYLKTVGASGQEEYAVAFRTYEDISKDLYNIEVKVNNEVVDTNFEALRGEVGYMYLWSKEMTYWLSIDKNKIAVGYQVSTSTHFHYFGGLNIYASLGHWFNRYCNFANGTDRNQNWRWTGANMFTAGGCRKLTKHDGQWMTLTRTLPYQSEMGQPKPAQFPTIGNAECFDIYPAFLKMSDSWVIGIIGECWDVYYVNGLGAATGDTFTTADGRSFVMLQNHLKTSPTDFIALEMK